MNVFFGGKKRSGFAIGFVNAGVVETGLGRGTAVDEINVARGEGRE